MTSNPAEGEVLLDGKNSYSSRPLTPTCTDPCGSAKIRSGSPSIDTVGACAWAAAGASSATAISGSRRRQMERGKRNTFLGRDEGRATGVNTRGCLRVAAILE